MVETDTKTGFKVADPLDTKTTSNALTVEEALNTEIVEETKKVDKDKVEEFVRSLISTKETAEGPSLVIDSVGSKEMKDMQALSKALNVPIKSMSANNSPTSVISDQLINLKVKLDEINPGKFDLQPGFIGRIIQKITGNTAVNKFVTKYEKTSNVIEAIARSLDEGAITLQEQNHIFFDDKKRYMDTSEVLKQKIAILMEADTKVDAMVEAEIDADKKKFLAEEVSFALKQHIQDLQQTLVVTQQGVLALDILVKNNKELIKGVDRAKKVTISALSIGATIAVGLSEQKRVLDTVEAVNQGTSDLIAENGKLLRSQGAAIQKQAMGTMLQFEKLVSAINDTVAAIEDVESFKQKALPEMSKAIKNLSDLSTYVDGKIQKIEKGERIQIEA